MKKLLFAVLLLPSFLIADEMREVVVLGGGVGGLTSALYLARAGLHPLVITGQNPGGALIQSPLVQNWPGELAIGGGELVEKIRKQAQESGTDFEAAEVVKVDFSRNLYKIVVRNPLKPNSERTIQTKTCIIATGAMPNMLGVPGESVYWLKGVHNCAVCDGNLYRDRDVIVVGGGDGAITEASHLAKLAKKVILIVRAPALKSIEAGRKEQLLATPNVEVLYSTTIQEIRGNHEHLTEVVAKNNVSGEIKTISSNALFLAIGSTPNTQLFKGQINLDEKGYILLVNQQQTNKAGVFAVGDVTDPYFRQAVTAAGDGAKAALQAEKLLASSIIQHKEEPSQPAEEPRVIAIRSIEHFEKEVLNSSTPVIVDFYADWCGPCKMLEPSIQTWSKQFSDKVKFAKVNIEQLGKLGQRYGIRAVPTVLYFDKGVLLESRTGMQEIAGLINSLDGFSNNQ